MKISRRMLLASGAVSLAIPHIAFAAGETIKVGVLHALSGTMAISETTLKDTMLMLIAAQNAKGGLLGKGGVSPHHLRAPHAQSLPNP